MGGHDRVLATDRKVPDMTPERRPPRLPLSVQEAAADIATLLGPATPQMVACGVVVRTWREAVEEQHARFSDAEMAYANVTTTHAVLPHCSTERVLWPAVRGVLADPDRTVLPGRSAVEVLGDAWPEVSADLDGRLEHVEVYPPALMVAFAHVMCPQWWGMPGWRARARAVAVGGAVTCWRGSAQELDEILVEDPTTLVFDVWRQVVSALTDDG